MLMYVFRLCHMPLSYLPAPHKHKSLNSFNLYALTSQISSNLLGSRFKELPVKRGRGRPPKPKDPLTDMEKNDGAAATRGRPAVKDISTNWHCIEDKVRI